MKPMTIRQPWVYAILHKGKNIENRSWKREFRGWIAHAASQPSKEALFPRVIQSGSTNQNGMRYFGWLLEDVTLLKTPFPCNGWLGLWDVPPAAMRKSENHATFRFISNADVESQLNRIEHRANLHRKLFD